MAASQQRPSTRIAADSNAPLRNAPKIAQDIDQVTQI